MIRNTGFLYMLTSRKRGIAFFVSIILTAVALPLIVVLSIQLSTKTGKNPLTKKLETCPLSPCTPLLISPQSAASDTFVAAFAKEFGVKSHEIKTFPNRQEMVDYMKGDGIGRFVYGVYLIGNDPEVFTRAKTINAEISDSKVVSSSLPRLAQVVQDYQNGPSSVKLNLQFVDIMAKETAKALAGAQLSTFSLVFFIAGIGSTALLAKLKDKKQYAYLVLSGLDRPQFYGGVLGWISLEQLGLSVIVSIICAAMRPINASAWANFVSALFVLPGSIAFSGSFGVFSMGLMKTTTGTTLFFLFIGFLLGYYIVILVPLLLSLSTMSGSMYQIIQALCQLLMPGSGPTVIFTQLAAIASSSQVAAMSLGGIITYSNAQSYPIWVTALLSCASGIIYFLAGIWVDQVGKYHLHPTTKRFFGRISMMPKNQAPCLEAKNLSVIFQRAQRSKGAKLPPVVALDNLNLKLDRQNAVVGLVAQNGAGKTTLFNAILGSVHPKSGSLTLDGASPSIFTHSYYRQLAVVLQENIIFEAFTVLDQMRLVGCAMGVHPSLGAIRQALTAMGLDSYENHVVSKLSGGQQRRLCVAQAMLQEHAALRIYDEPACGVDIESRRYLWTYLREKKDCLTILTTHIMEEAEELCDDVVILKEGKLVAHGSLMFVKQKLGGGYKIVTPELSKEELATMMGSDAQIEQTANGPAVRVVQEDVDSVQATMETLRSAGVKFQIRCPSLTEVFLRVCEEDVVQLVE